MACALRIAALAPDECPRLRHHQPLTLVLQAHNRSQGRKASYRGRVSGIIHTAVPSGHSCYSDAPCVRSHMHLTTQYITQHGCNVEALHALALTAAQGRKGDKIMLPIIRIIIAGAILTVWSHVVPAKAAHSVAIGQSSQAVDAALATKNCCPLRAWPYIG